MLQIPIVSVCMITYNQEKFIEQAIEGVLMQQCNFKIELIIADDTSPDNTDTIIRNFINTDPRAAAIIKYTKHTINLGVMANFIWTLKQCKGKYIALCDGDDYWTDPYKLQKQVDFLEAKLDYVLVGSYANTHKGNIVETPKNIEFRNFDFHDTARGIPIPTLTYCFRNLHNYDNFNYPVGDMGLLFEVSKNGGKMGKLPFVSGVYNYHGGGLNSGNSRFDNKKLQVETLYLMGKRTDDYYFKFIIRWGFLKLIIRELKAILLFRRKNYNTFFLALIYFLKK